ncbi:MAG: cation:proton antiporter [Anaerolineales bacterium]
MTAIAILAALIFLYSLISHRLERTILTGPMIFTTAGILLYFAMPNQFGAIFDVKPILLLMEIALAVVLFTDGTRIKVADLIGSATLPGRLLVIGMPLIILAGTIAAALMFTDLSIWEAAILGAILAPTDAGLGHAVMSSKRVPARIRQALNVEAGLNDGLAIPFLMLFIALARVDQPLSDRSWIVYLIQEVGLGILLGLLFGWIGGRLMGQANKRKWMSTAMQQLALLSMAILSWVVIEVSSGNGFIGAFVVGLVIKNGYQSAGEQMVEFSEVWGQLLNLFVFAVFGTLVGPILGNFGTLTGLYALLSLTIVRMLPVGISLIGAQLYRSTILFIGWFGPRGLASIVLGLIFLKEEANLAGENLISLVVAATVLLSVFAHGVSAAPGINVYAKQVEQMDYDDPERQEAVKMPVRY